MDELKIRSGVRDIIEGIGLDLGDPNLKDTPDRIVRMYREILNGHMEDLDERIAQILQSAFPSPTNNLVLMRDIETFSLCPHHLLPVHYKITVAYIPNGSVIGLSKLPRIVNLLARRLVLQETLTEEIADTLMNIPRCQGAACIAEGVHYCMVMRGVRQSQATTITSSLRGAFLSPDSSQSVDSRQELLDLLGLRRR